MIRRLRKDQQGMGHVLIIVLVVVLLGVGGVGYYVWNKNKDKDSSASNASLSEAAKVVASECKKEIDDDDFCKFASSYTADESMKVTFTTVSADGTSVMAMESDGKDNSKAVTTVNGTETASYVLLNKTTYTKDYSDGAWFKFANETPETPAAEAQTDEELDFDFSDDTADSTVTYKKIGKEACGNSTCFKYQVVDTTSTDENFIWFDDKDYKLRRLLTSNAEGSTDMVYEYTAVTITEPAPVKEMPNYENMSAEELQQLMEQYAQ